jgi:trehalose 6-phosphate phosphatase
MNDANPMRFGVSRPATDPVAPIALFLDFDGTLVDIAPTPDTVVVPPELPDLLARLTRALGGALAIVSGRPIAQIDRMLAPLRPVVAGGHGAEIRTAPDEPVHGLARPLDPHLAARVCAWAATVPGLLVEPKQASLAIHFRSVPQARDLVETKLRGFLAEAPGHRLLAGRSVWEILPATVAKGAAVDFLMARPPFLGRRPLVVGDDVTDVSAFDAGSRAGGSAARVAGETWPAAVAEFRDPTAVRAFLAHLLEETDR